MAIKAKLRDASGNCCCGSGTCSIYCSTRGGTATLCGFDEFTSPSVPPRKYRRRQLDGVLGQVFYQGVPGDNCAGTITGTSTETISGACQYNSTTCAVTNDGTLEQVGTGCFSSPDTIQPLSCNGGFTSAPDTITRTVKSVTKTGCGLVTSFGPCFGNGTNFANGNTQSITLSDEDTDSDAIARIPGITIWGDYTPCFTGSCCRTAYQIRGAGEFSFEYVEARAKVKGVGFTPGAAITAKIDILRKPYGTGTYLLYSTFEVDGTAGMDGRLDIDMGVLPNDPGYETVCSNCRTVPTPP